MTVEQAITELTEWGIISTHEVDQDLQDAVKLGIEALKLIKDIRIEGCFRCPPPLPGETS